MLSPNWVTSRLPVSFINLVSPSVNPTTLSLFTAILKTAVADPGYPSSGRWVHQPWCVVNTTFWNLLQYLKTVTNSAFHV